MRIANNCPIKKHSWLETKRKTIWGIHAKINSEYWISWISFHTAWHAVFFWSSYFPPGVSLFTVNGSLLLVLQLIISVEIWILGLVESRTKIQSRTRVFNFSTFTFIVLPPTTIHSLNVHWLFRLSGCFLLNKLNCKNLETLSHENMCLSSFWCAESQQDIICSCGLAWFIVNHTHICSHCRDLSLTLEGWLVSWE